MNINWRKVSKDYNGIAIVPNPDWYFPINHLTAEFDKSAHLWLRTYDVSSLIIWRNNDNTIVKHYEIGKISNLIELSKKKKEKLEDLIINKIRNI